MQIAHVSFHVWRTVTKRSDVAGVENVTTGAEGIGYFVMNQIHSGAVGLVWRGHVLSFACRPTHWTMSKFAQYSYCPRHAIIHNKTLHWYHDLYFPALSPISHGWDKLVDAHLNTNQAPNTDCLSSQGFVSILRIMHCLSSLVVFLKNLEHPSWIRSFRIQTITITDVDSLW